MQETNNNVQPSLLETETKIENAPEIVEETQLKSRLKSAFDELINAFKEEKLLPFFKPFSTKLRTKWENVDNTWTQKYGNRYQALKDHLKTVDTWYGEEKSKVEAGAPTPVERKQAKWKTKASELGASIAQKEKQIKQRLQELWPKK